MRSEVLRKADLLMRCKGLLTDGNGGMKSAGCFLLFEEGHEQLGYK